MQFVRFLLVGGTATAFHYAVLFALIQGGLAGPVVATSIGFALSVVLNYWLSRQFTFRSTREHTEALPRFVAVSFMGLVINGSIVWFVHYPLQQSVLLAQVVATGFTLFWHYAAHRLWTFREVST